MIDPAITFPSQVSLPSLIHSLIYILGAAGMIFLLFGLLLIDAGTVKKQNAFTSGIEKLVGFFIGFGSYLLFGFGLWLAQYYLMRGNSLTDSISDWWLGGTMTNSLAQAVDPARFSHVNEYQIFLFFLACTAGIINVLFHFAVSERIKASAYYLTCVVAALGSSLLSWWTWGSVGPLTNAGYHDFFGVGFVYLFPAGMAIVLVSRLGPRPGIFSEGKSSHLSHYSNPVFATIGTVMIFAALPMVIISCLFFFEKTGFAVSVTMADTSIGLVLNNYGAAWLGGMLSGALIAYLKRNYNYLLLGPFAGYVSGAAGFDVYLPWQMLLVAMVAPVVAALVDSALRHFRIDETKLIPLFAGAGSYGLIMVGILHSGTPRGGYFGLSEGDFAFQHDVIGLPMQAAGIVLCLGGGILVASLLCVILKRTTGLRISDNAGHQGLDHYYWEIEYSEER
ncbi:ammonium transporter [Methylophaga sp.]|jgi:ammonia channel protein AmtB|uniref:ammonium transporter n=1 Tax=Methylophaga sp. TaxID=2024840 RepID=UPI0014000BFA|nr:ammonium transporter [Methylophaga sp.]MTI63870.1 ammonium transporter [Methylophaga sp.]